jgi:N-acetylglucosamine malate deacetylase 1
MQQLDILAIAAHPDDVELSASGILHSHSVQGYKTGILDLTQGELGSKGSVALRYKEAHASSKVLGLQVRDNLQLADGFFENNKANQLLLISKIRAYQPKIVLINAPHDRHPDHGKGAKLAQDACFLSGLIKIETQDANGKKQVPWRPKRIYHYIQDTFIEPDFIIDISNSWAAKLQSIQCFESQFSNVNINEPATYISQNTFLQSIEARAILLGKQIGAPYGEGLLKCEASIGVKNLFDLSLPEFS